MNGYKSNTFTDRASASAKAKTALLEKFKLKPAADDPEVLARQAERQAIIEAREARAAVRRLVREAEAVELARLAALKLEEQKLVEAAALAAKQEDARRAVEAAKAAKAARDARYAARKARR